MTPSEKLLENALAELSNKYANELERLANELTSLREENALITQMFKATQEQNKQISEQLTTLTGLINRSKIL